MNQFPVYVPKLLPAEENYISGRRSCQGCGKALAARIVAKAAGAVLPDQLPLQASITAQSYAYDELTFDPMLENMQAELVRASAMAGASCRKAMVGIDRRLFLSGQLVAARMFTRDENALYICFDNEPHIDRLISMVNPPDFRLAEVSHTVPAAKIKNIIKEKNIPAAVAEGNFPYIATACPSYPFDLIEKVKKGLAASGNAFILILAPCPTGWVFNPKLTIKAGLMAVRTGYFPLYEIENNNIKITQKVLNRKPVQDYLKMQKRFFPFPPELIPVVQEAVNEGYEELLQKAQA
jgi:pyruvate ferredoxin oxidoreductase beta subunit